MTRTWFLAAIAVLTLVGCSSGATETSTAAGSEEASAEEVPFELDAAPVNTTEVTAVKSYKFDPQVIEVEVGSEVTWTNEDDFPHNVHFLTGSDETYDLPMGESASVTFDEAGDFYYECSLHPQQMRAKVIVSQ
jgi:plastocyanin